jgi:hypothetical protein
MANYFGTELWLGIGPDGSLDVDPAMRETSGLQVLAQSLVMRQFTPTGSSIGNPNECVDLRNFLSAGLTQSQTQQIGAVVQQQLLRDQRVQTVSVQATFNTSTGILTVTENIVSNAGPFTLTLSVSNVTVTLLLNGIPLGGGLVT